MQTPLTNSMEFSIFTISNNQIKETDMNIIITIILMSIGSFAQNTSYKDGTDCYCDSIIQKYGESGNLIYERSYVNDRLHGMEVYYHENGMIK